MTGPDGSSLTVPALIGAVEDGDRLLILMNLETTALTGGAGAAPVCCTLAASAMRRPVATTSEPARVG